MKTPKEMTAEEFFDSNDIEDWLYYIVEHSAWRVPNHLIEEVCHQAAAIVAAYKLTVNPGVDSES